jgi:hypothetical protein
MGKFDSLKERLKKNKREERSYFDTVNMEEEPSPAFVKSNSAQKGIELKNKAN